MASKKQTFQDSKAVCNFLRARYAIPQSTFEQIRLTLAQEALLDAEDMMYNRIYSAVILALHRAYGFGQIRINRLLRELDNVSSWVTDKNVPWSEIMRVLDEETGIIIRRGESGNWLVEYKTKEERETGVLME